MNPPDGKTPATAPQKNHVLLIDDERALLDVYGAALKDDVYDAMVKRRDPSSPRWGMSGFYASVAVPGWVRTGDAISLLSKLA